MYRPNSNLGAGLDQSAPLSSPGRYRNSDFDFREHENSDQGQGAMYRPPMTGFNNPNSKLFTRAESREHVSYGSQINDQMRWANTDNRNPAIESSDSDDDTPTSTRGTVTRNRHYNPQIKGEQFHRAQNLGPEPGFDTRAYTNSFLRKPLNPQSNQPSGMSRGRNPSPQWTNEPAENESTAGRRETEGYSWTIANSSRPPPIPVSPVPSGGLGMANPGLPGLPGLPLPFPIHALPFMGEMPQNRTHARTPMQGTDRPMAIAERNNPPHETPLHERPRYYSSETYGPAETKSWPQQFSGPIQDESRSLSAPTYHQNTTQPMDRPPQFHNAIQEEPRLGLLPNYKQNSMQPRGWPQQSHNSMQGEGRFHPLSPPSYNHNATQSMDRSRQFHNSVQEVSRPLSLSNSLSLSNHRQNPMQPGDWPQQFHSPAQEESRPLSPLDYDQNTTQSVDRLRQFYNPAQEISRPLSLPGYGQTVTQPKDRFKQIHQPIQEESRPLSLPNYNQIATQSMQKFPLPSPKAVDPNHDQDITAFTDLLGRVGDLIQVKSALLPELADAAHGEFNQPSPEVEDSAQRESHQPLPEAVDSTQKEAHQPSTEVVDVIQEESHQQLPNAEDPVQKESDPQSPKVVDVVQGEPLLSPKVEDSTQKEPHQPSPEAADAVQEESNPRSPNAEDLMEKESHPHPPEVADAVQEEPLPSPQGIVLAHNQTHTEPRDRTDFEIAIICALGVESNAVELIFDEFWVDTFGKDAKDKNCYTHGRIGNFNVVLVGLSEMGTISALNAASDLNKSYEVHLALLVGICGGMPQIDDKNDIFLGDVIISNAIVQYDFGKRRPDGFEHIKTGSRQLHPNIRNFLTTIKRHRIQDLLHSQTAAFLQKLQDDSAKKGWDDYTYPGSTHDILFAPNHLHRNHGSAKCGCKKCESKANPDCPILLKETCSTLGCGKEPNQGHLVPRDRLKSKRRNGAEGPALYIGAIGSGNTVMRSGEDRDEIAKKANIIAFEMEGAGVEAQLPCIVVKGVCDYADSHKNKDWQNFAAATAAAASKALLEQYPKPGKSA